ncbi:hypothetical protein SXCC_01640 [Gluconacetobacter sp. SXCC-1]|nr:hypothetical protein SXCC_01640 [Gluconacetobacter sp. SXCC-1]
MHLTARVVISRLNSSSLESMIICYFRRIVCMSEKLADYHKKV